MTKKQIVKSFLKHKESFTTDILFTSGDTYKQQLEALLHEIGHMILLWPTSYKDVLATNDNCNKLIYEQLLPLDKDLKFDDLKTVINEAGLTYDGSDQQELIISAAVINVSRQLRLGLDEKEIADNARMNTHRRCYFDLLKDRQEKYLTDVWLDDERVKLVADKLIELLTKE